MRLPVLPVLTAAEAASIVLPKGNLDRFRQKGIVAFKSTTQLEMKTTEKKHAMT